MSNCFIHRILLIIENLHAGGKQRQFIELIKGLLNNTDYQVKVVLFTSRIEYPIFNTLNLDLEIIRGNNLTKLNNLIRIIKDYLPHIIHSWGKLCTLFSIPAVLFYDCKLIDGSIRYASPVKKLSKFWIISVINFYFASKVIANSYAGLKAHNLTNNSKNNVIYNGFDFQRLNGRKNFTKEELKINTKYVVGMIARFDDLKDYNTFIDAAIGVISKRNDVSFLCIGDGPNRSAVEKKVPNKIQRKIQFLGRISEVERVLNILSIGILTNNIHGHAEGLSNTLMEYMAARKPVIATSAGGNIEIIQDKISGYLVSAYNAEEVEKYINYLLDNPEKMKMMGSKGRATIEEKFGYREMINAYTRIYREISFNNAT